jgi:nicotinate dehydrogenase subunit B
MGMDVAVEGSTGAVRVLRVACAHDCGVMINPDAVRAQVEGCILQTRSRTLFEEVTFDRSRVTSTDWASYPILTFRNVPRLEIVLTDRRDEFSIGRGRGGDRSRGGRCRKRHFRCDGRQITPRAVYGSSRKGGAG